jgi:polysaccharide chain length determinant protein (PEP-CTERM system associated)
MVEILNQIRSLLRAFWLHRWLGLLVAWGAGLVGMAVVYVLPDQYEATTRVFVDTQSILKPLMRDLAVQPNVDQQVQMMSRNLLNRQNIEKVIRMSDLDVAVRSPSEREALVDSLLRNIEMKVAGAGTNLYTITYRNSKPDKAKQVVSALLTLFVEANLGDKRKDADQARRFIDEQIKVYEQKLIGAENALKDFKIKNMAVMPGIGKDYFSRMNDMSIQLQAAKLELKEAENSRDAIKRQLTGEEPTLMQQALPDLIGSSPSAAAAAAAQVLAPVPLDPVLEQRLDAMRKRLDEMRMRYTEQHPDIVASKRIILQLEEQKAEFIEAYRAAQARAPKPAANNAQAQALNNAKSNPVFEQLRVSYTESEANIAALKTRVAEYSTRVTELQGLAGAVPKAEADFSQLNRDYDVNKVNYEKLLSRREAAQMSGEMDANTGIGEFRVIEPPRVANKPVAPNRTQLLVLALFAALGVGVLVTMVRSQMNPVFTDRRILRTVTGLPILGSVTLIKTGEFNVARRKSLAVFFLGLIGLIGLYVAAVTYFTLKSGALEKTLL